MNGRVIGGLHYSTQQVVTITGVTSLGGGAYTITISPGVYSTNIRVGQAPGAWWPGFVQNDGIENMTLDGGSITGGTNVEMFSCYQCWATGVTFLNGARSSIWLYQSNKDVIRNNYFYGAQSHAATSYNIELDTSSDALIENNITQQVTTFSVFNGGAMGNVVDYNFAVNNIFGPGTYTWGIFPSHSADDNFNLFEGNIVNTFQLDNASGPANQEVYFRNLVTGLQPGTVNTTNSFLIRANNRTQSIIGNVLGTAGYHTQYSLFATGTTTLSGSAGTEAASVYSLGGGGTGMVCANVAGSSTVCDPRTNSTMMRWGNYDTVNAAIKWDSTEASPAAVTYVGANFTSTYFNSLAHTLPASLVYNSTPAWWPKAWPSIGPDVSTGNVGTCSGGTYSGWLATSFSQCTGGTFATAWASHVISNLAMDCYLNTMSGPPNGTGSALTFNAAACYTASSSPLVSLSPSSLTFGPQVVGTSSSSQAITLTNTGGSVLTITSISASGDYTQSNTCGISVVANASCTINVTFTPTTIGTRTGSISIIDNAAGSPHTAGLNGTGSAPTIYRPTTFVDSGVNPVVNPTFAYDGNFATFASGTATVPSGTVQPYTIVYSGFPATVGMPANAALYLYNDSYNTGCSLGGEQAEYSLNGGSTWSQLWVGPTHGVQNIPLIDSVVMLPGQQFSQVQVRFGFLSGGTPTGCSLTTQMYEVWIQTGVVASQFSGGNLIVGGGLIQ